MAEENTRTFILEWDDCKQAGYKGKESIEGFDKLQARMKDIIDSYGNVKLIVWES